MINKLRFRFIKITMAAVTLVLAVIIASINIVNIKVNTDSLDSITKRLSREHFAVPPKGGAVEMPVPDFSDLGFDKKFAFQNEKELPFSSRFFSIHIDENADIIGFNLNRIASVDESELDGIKNRVLDINAETGWYNNYRYRITEEPHGTTIVFLEASATKNAFIYVLLTCITVGVIAFLVILAITAFFSKRAIAPIAETYEKQKQFIADAGHELKTPLAIIAADADVISMIYGSNEWCDGISKQIKQMRLLVDRMIRLAKLEELKESVSYSAVNLSDVVAETAESFETLAICEKIDVSENIEPDIVVAGDESSLRQLVSILTDNAIKYCDENGRVVVELSARKNHAVLEISNSYKDAEALDTNKIFDRFYRTDKARESADSFGLGLSIAMAAAEWHHGELQCIKKSSDMVSFRLVLKTIRDGKR